MAMHDFECSLCEMRVEDVYLKPGAIDGHEELCPRCLSPMVQSFKNFKGFRPFTPYVDQHMMEQPVEITSREQRRDLMRKNNLSTYPAGHGEPGCMV